MLAKFLLTPSCLPIALVLAAAPARAGDHTTHHGNVELAATLNGANEVNAQGIRNQGDPDGAGLFSGRLSGQDQLCYTLTWTGIDAPTMAHIHNGAAGVNGGVLVSLADIGAGEHCITLESVKAAALGARPQDYYVNIHNAAFPAGALRGQVAHK